jgi:hypothetical protein
MQSAEAVLEIIRKRGRQGLPLMAARRRKTMALCVECHDDLHAGRPPNRRATA